MGGLNRGLNLRFQLAGGISTLESGFQIAWVEDDHIPVLCFLCDSSRNAFARFNKDKTYRVSQGGLSRAELEAVQGMKRLVLRWDN